MKILLFFVALFIFSSCTSTSYEGGNVKSEELENKFNTAMSYIDTTKHSLSYVVFDKIDNTIYVYDKRGVLFWQSAYYNNADIKVSVLLILGICIVVAGVIPIFIK